MDDAIKAFTKPDAITPAPAYNKTNVQVIKMDSSSIANLSRNMIKDMTSVASSNIDYIRTAKNEILLLEPYVNSLNALSACNKNTLKDQTVQDYVDDRMTKVGSMLPVLKLEVVNIPPRVAVLIDSIKFVASSTDVNAIQAVYQAFNQEIDTGALKKSESADVAENKYQQLDIQINGPRDENGTPLAKGEMENKIKPKLLQCGCKANSGFVWEGNSCLSPEEQLRNDNPEAYHS